MERLLLGLQLWVFTLATPGAFALLPAMVPPPERAPGYEKTVRSLFDQAHSIAVYVRYIETRKKPAKVAEIERVLRDRQTFHHVQDILLAHAAEVRPVAPEPGYAATSVYVILEFRDAQGSRVGSLRSEIDLLEFKPGGNFEVDSKILREVVRLFLFHGDRMK